MFKAIVNHIKARREFNRFKRNLAARATSRCLINLLAANGALTTMRRARA